MPTIHVVKPFTFQHDPKQTGEYKDEKTGKMVQVFAVEGEREQFTVGFHEVPEHIAEHWYVKAHLEGYEQPPPNKAQPDFAFQMKALQAGRAARNTTSMAEAAPPPAPLPPNVLVTQPQPQERHYFAGNGPLENKQAPEAPSWMR